MGQWNDSPMPAQVFIHAVRLAGLETNHTSQHEEFESIKSLCEWWNTHAPNQEYRCAGYFKLWVKAWAGEDADIKYYRNADLESPVVLIEDLSMNSAGNAAVGESIVLEFMKGCKHFTARGVNNDFIQTYNVTGAQNDSIDSTLAEAQSGERDEAWHAYKALLLFPTNFPAVWAALLDSINHGDNSQVF